MKQLEEQTPAPRDARSIHERCQNPRRAYERTWADTLLSGPLLASEDDFKQTRRVKLKAIPELEDFERFLLEAIAIQGDYRKSSIFKTADIRQLKVTFDQLDDLKQARIAWKDFTQKFTKGFDVDPRLKQSAARMFENVHIDLEFESHLTFLELANKIYPGTIKEEREQMACIVGKPPQVTPLIMLKLRYLFDEVSRVSVHAPPGQLCMSDLASVMMRTEEFYKFVAARSRFNRSRLCSFMTFHDILMRLFPRETSDTYAIWKQWAQDVPKGRDLISKRREDSLRRLYHQIDSFNKKLSGLCKQECVWAMRKWDTEHAEFLSVDIQNEMDYHKEERIEWDRFLELVAQAKYRAVRHDCLAYLPAGAPRTGIRLSSETKIDIGETPAEAMARKRSGKSTTGTPNDRKPISSPMSYALYLKNLEDRRQKAVNKSIHEDHWVPA